MELFCFIITRYVKDKKTNKYWKECCKNIRLLYKELIIIIDDNSDDKFLTNDIEFDNVLIVKSEYPERAEFLPYYYFFHFKWAQYAIIIHDSTFIQKKIDFDWRCPIRFIWHFTNRQISSTIRTKILNMPSLMKYLNNNNWVGCFGIQSIISIDFLTTIYIKYNFDQFLIKIRNRQDRMDFERIFAFICLEEFPNLLQNPSICGDIYQQHRIIYYLDFTIYEKMTHQTKREYKFLKCFSGR